MKTDGLRVGDTVRLALYHHPHRYTGESVHLTVTKKGKAWTWLEGKPGDLGTEETFYADKYGGVSQKKDHGSKKVGLLVDGAEWLKIVERVERDKLDTRLQNLGLVTMTSWPLKDLRALIDIIESSGWGSGSVKP